MALKLYCASQTLKTNMKFTAAILLIKASGSQRQKSVSACSCVSISSTNPLLAHTCWRSASSASEGLKKRERGGERERNRLVTDNAMRERAKEGEKKKANSCVLGFVLARHILVWVRK